MLIGKYDLKIDNKQGNKLWFCCPFPHGKKKENRPSLEVKLSGKYRGKWFCWGCRRYGRVSNEEIAMFRDEFESEKELDWTSYNEGDEDLGYWSHYLNTSTMLLKEFGCKTIKGDPKHLLSPIYCNLTRKKIGYQHRVLDTKWNESGSKEGVFKCYTGLEVDREPLIITEGLSDALSVKLLLPLYEVVGRLNAHSSLATPHNKVMIIADNDPIGLSGADKLANELEKAGKKVSLFVPNNKDIRLDMLQEPNSIVKTRLEKFIEVNYGTY